MSVRVLAGEFKGSVLSVPDSARPTQIRSRQSLFDILAGASLDGERSDPKNFFKDKTVLDCFAGSGALGIESLSRGASFAYFADASSKAMGAILENTKKLNIQDRCRILKTDVLKIKKFTEEKCCDLVFIDPPYGKVSIRKTIQNLANTGWINENSLLITEEDCTNSEDLSGITLCLLERKLRNSIFRILKLL